MAERHVSRWRLMAATPPHVAANTSNAAADTKAQVGTGVSLRYLDEFVRKLQCAPRLLEHQLFPDAKEITESMGLFNAVRRYVITSDSEQPPQNPGTTHLVDGIVVVGDGNTPRSAALFAFRLKHWKCYSIDPAMERTGPDGSTRAQSWSSIENLVVVRNKIENVSIQLRRAVVVLVHAHVTLAQALSAVDCDELVGVVTMPCCNWYGKQEALAGRAPSIVYDDFSILSDHRELRVWVDPRGDHGATAAEFTLDQSAAMAKGCVRKEFHADFGVLTREDGIETEEEKKTKKHETVVHATTLFQEVLAGQARAESTPVSTRPSAVASPAQCETVAAHVESLLGNKSARVLVLTADGPLSQSELVRSLLRQGVCNVYGLQSSTGSERETDGCLHAEIVKLELTTDSSALSASTVSQCQTTSADSDGDPSYEALITPATDEDRSRELFDCVVDLGFLHRCLRNQPKKTSGVAFQRLVQLALSMTMPTPLDSPDAKLITVSPRKDWRKPEFLANKRLHLAFSTLAIAADAAASTGPLYLYASLPASETATPTKVPSGGKETSQTQKKQLALQLKRALENDFASSLVDTELAVSTLAEARAAVDLAARRVQVRGVVQHQRRFTTGPSFFSLAPVTGEALSSFRDHVQVSMDPERLARWDSITTEISLDAVCRLLHKGDRVECVGVMTRNAQQQPTLQLDALRFLESEFQAYE